MDEKLVVLDPSARLVTGYGVGTWQEERRHVGTAPADHPGVLRLGAGRATRLLYVDDSGGRLVAVAPFAREAEPWCSDVAGVAVPGEHLAASPAGDLVVVTTGLGEAEEPWNDRITVVDLAAPGGPRSHERTLRVGEPGVVVTSPSVGAPRGRVVVRHREPGRLDVFDVRSLLAGTPRPVPEASTPLPHDGHGDALVPALGLVLTATGAGVHRTHVGDDGLSPLPVLPWQGPGRGHYLKLDPGGDAVWSTVRGPGPPERWHEWSNHLWRADLRTGAVTTWDLGPGLVFRLALTADRAATTRCHPDGDEVVSVRPGEAAVHRVDLEPMQDGPRAGEEAWAAERRAVAGSPTTDLVAVTRGGHGQVVVVDTDPTSPVPLVRTLRTPGPLRTGGHLVWVGPDAGVDVVGR